jgi:hypothetical protein
MIRTFRTLASMVKGMILSNGMRDRILVGDEPHRMSRMQVCLGEEREHERTEGRESLERMTPQLEAIV